MRARLPLTLGLVAALLLAWAAWPKRSGEAGREAPRSQVRFVGRTACAECHPRESEAWARSEHALAMQVASESTVLGDFDDARATHFGRESSFHRRDGKFLARTEGPDGKPGEFEVAYTFGVDPLQQYLVAFPGGRYQVLPWCWDTRPASRGGQRWFHLYTKEPIRHDDELYWTGPAQNWNFMCAECHSTDLRKGYVADEDRYETRWAEIEVSCEACHGPGSAHVEWARAGSGDADGRKGLVLSLRERERVPFVFDPADGIARRARPREDWSELESCARCHARRGVLAAAYEHGRPLLDTHRPALLTEGLYHADGQILDEVFEYGSFLQSRMHAAGVTCGDCHDPHSLALPSPADAVCARCHQPERFATPEHHHHEPGTPGSSCVECHMPARTYMVVDPRRDHSFRVPRPDLGVELGTPDACTGCHVDRDAPWAAEAVRAWYPRGRHTQAHYARALAAGRSGAPGAGALLADLIRDARAPAIVRATAFTHLDAGAGRTELEALALGLADADPLVRFGALEALASLDARARIALALPMLDDPVRAVRAGAAGVLAELPPGSVPAERRAAYERALAEHEEELFANADRAGSLLRLGVLALARGDEAGARRWYERGLALEPRFAPLYVNLADLCRSQGRDSEGEALLLEGIRQAPAAAALHHALGLLLIRAGRLGEALDPLERAFALDPRDARNALVLGLALEAAGDEQRALESLRAGLEQRPYDRELLLALAQRELERGERDSALALARRLRELAPDDPAARALLEAASGAGR